MEGVERAGQHHARGRSRGHQLAIGPRRHAREAARQELVDRITGLHDGLRVALVGIQQAARRGRGDATRAGQPQHDGARDEVFFGRAVSPPLGQHD